MAWTQYQSGVLYPILHKTETNLPHIQGSCIPTVRQYLCDIGGSIQIDHTYAQRPLRHNDRSIMEMALEHSLTDIQLTRISCVRMYLGVMYFSKICKPDGKSILPGVKKRERDTDEYKTKLTRPYQPKPNSESWDLWDRIILPTTRADNKTLIRPLRPWTKHHSTAGVWTPYMHGNGTVYTKNKNNTMWSQYRKASTQLHFTTDDKGIAAGTFPKKLFVFCNVLVF